MRKRRAPKMRLFYLTFALLCVIIELNGNLQALEIAPKMAIDTISYVMDLYNNDVDQDIPWPKLKQIAFELGQFETKLVSKQSSEQIRSIKTQLLSAIDEYDSATQSIYEGCGSSTLSTYIKLFDSPNPAIFAVQKTLMINLLNSAIERLKKGQKELEDTFSVLKSVSEKFRSLVGQLKSEHDQDSDHFNEIVDDIVDEKSSFFSFFIKGQLEDEAVKELKAKIKPIRKFYKDANAVLRQARINLGKITSKLDKNLETIEQQKAQVIASNAEDASKVRDDIAQSAQSLIEKCQEYRERHA